jgi:hypothetical protein
MKKHKGKGQCHEAMQEFKKLGIYHIMTDKKESHQKQLYEAHYVC